MFGVCALMQFYCVRILERGRVCLESAFKADCRDVVANTIQSGFLL